MNKEQYFSLADELAKEAGVVDGLHRYYLQHRERLWITACRFGLFNFSGLRVLEIGPFFSYTPFVLQKNGNAVTVLEGDDPAVHPLKALYARRGIELTLADFFDSFAAIEVEKHRFPFPDCQFELVNCWETMEHFNFNPVGFVKDLHRVLKPGGSAFITVPNVAKFGTRLKLMLGRPIGATIDSFHQFYGYEGKRFLGFHWREYTLGELAELFSRQGFTITSASHLVTFESRPQITLLRKVKRLVGRAACAVVPSGGTICSIVAQKKS